MSDTTSANIPRFIVFNYVTSKIEQSENSPNFGDPNRDLQSAALNAYTGSAAGSSSLSSGTSTPGPTAATLGQPAAQAIAAAEANLTPEVAQQVQQAFGSIGQIGQVPAMLGTMSAHANNVLDNATRVFDTLDTVVRPEEAGSPNRCVSLGDFIGSIQGSFNSAISGITNGLNQITSALLSVPTAIINSVVSAANALTAAITSGITSAINSAISAVTSVTNGFFNSVGSSVTSLFNSVGSAVSSVFAGITAEVNNLSAALNRVLNNPFQLVSPNVSPCLRQVFAGANSTFEPIRLTPAQLELRRLSSQISQQVQQF